MGYLVKRELICIQTESCFIGNGGRVFVNPVMTYHFAPWKRTLIFDDGREVYVEDDTQDEILQVLIKQL